MGDTPLCTALCHRHWDIAKRLLTEAHCDVNCVLNERGSNSYPLHYAYIHGQLDIVELLHGNPSLKDSNGDTPLHVETQKLEAV